MRWNALPPEPSPSVLERFFAKKVSLRLVVVIVLFFSLGTVAFAWYVKRSVGIGDEHPLAQAAVKVASFPGDVKDVVLELHRLALGETDLSDVRATPSEKQWSDFAPVTSGLKNKVEGLIVRRGAGSPARGWRIIVGAFKVDGAVQNAALMLSPGLRIVHYWPLLEDGL